jgi:hypothetical protein
VFSVSSFHIHLTYVDYFASVGFYISAMWLSGTKKFVEQLQKNLADYESQRKGPSKKVSKVQRRREAECAKPSTSMTTEITCSHGSLALSSARSKRRLITARMWHFLRRFYPDGPSFKCSLTSECTTCAGANSELAASARAEKQLLITERKLTLVPPVLEPVCARKSGVPMQCVTSRVAFYSGMATLENGGEGTVDEQGISDSIPPEAAPLFPGTAGQLVQPLIPGLYNLVPREWLRAWRSYVKDAEAPRLPHLSCASLLCQAHRQLVVPPHLEEYLIGIRPTLLGGLGLYPGEVVEVLSADEWDALQDVFRDAGDFSARFCLDGSGGVYWSAGVCTVCEPFTYTPLLGRVEKKRNAARSVQNDDEAPYAVL